MTKEKAKRNTRPCPVCGEIYKGKEKFAHIQAEHPELKLAYRYYEKDGSTRQQLYCTVCGKDTGYNGAKRHINCGQEKATRPLRIAKCSHRTRVQLGTLTPDQLIGELLRRFDELVEENAQLKDGIAEIGKRVRNFGLGNE